VIFQKQNQRPALLNYPLQNLMEKGLTEGGHKTTEREKQGKQGSRRPDIECNI
jgi:hypothetical protein